MKPLKNEGLLWTNCFWKNFRNIYDSEIFYKVNEGTDCKLYRPITINIKDRIENGLRNETN